MKRLLSYSATVAEDDQEQDQDQLDQDHPVLPENWTGVLAPEGVLTGDGRMIEPGALRWENLPLPLRHVASDVGAHDGAVVVGRINTVSREPDGMVTASGDFDLSSEAGREAARQVVEGLKTGVSVDLDAVSFEVRVAADLLAEEEVAAEEVAEETDEDGRVVVAKINSDDEVMVTTDARLRAATLVDVPAFLDARIHPADGEQDHSDQDQQDQDQQDQDQDSLTAAAIPAAPPAEWFQNPGLDAPTPLTVTEDGRVYGHLAAWGTCHTAHTGQCVTPPHSRAGYAYFRTGSVLTTGGEVATGVITLDTRHARTALRSTDAVAHYEHTGRGVADVAAGEDHHGIWVAGALRPSATDDQVRALRASPLSGDWRMIGGNLELVAALAVNVPGFPVPRPAGLVASGGMITSLVASGMIAPTRVRPSTLSEDDLRYLKRLADNLRDQDQEQRRVTRDRARALATKIRAESLAARVRS